MKIALDKELCSGCSACAQICSHGAISMNADREGFVYPTISESLCVECGLCEKVCPYVESEKKIIKNSNPDVYAAWHLDEDIRKVSSSGGIFTALASYVLENNGAVVGAGFTKDLKLQHQFIDKVDQLAILRGSKYLQSDINNTFSETKELLKSNKLVLFVGTPCQVGGLKSFLFNKNYENLITCDIVCHGVPSPMIFDKYIKEQKIIGLGMPISVNFRDKKIGWKAYSVSYVYPMLKKSRLYFHDCYMCGFINNLFLRPCCSDCKFNGIKRISDLTLGDYWGIEKYYNIYDYDKGVSMIFVNSDKGRLMYLKIRNKVCSVLTIVESAINCNPSIFKSSEPHKDRELFFLLLNKSVSTLVRKFCDFPKFNKRIVLYIKIILNKYLK